jgi:succinyl-CoA synthetase beta subunit
MNIHEFQAKELFRRHGVPVLDGIPVTSADEAVSAAEKLGTPVVVVKSQIHAGGRGKGTVYADAGCTELVMEGGVKLAKSPAEAGELTGKLLGNWLKTKQTGDSAKQVGTVYIESGCAIANELYLSILLDRAVGKPVVVASAEGGMDIEEVAESTPEAIHREHFDAAEGLHGYQVRKLGFAMGLSPKQIGALIPALQKLAKLFIEEDCDLVEVNPLVVTEDDGIVALDAKLSVDDNALFRHKEVAAWRDPNEEDPAELEAKEHGMAFVKLDGNIGCLVNGAGLAMATMDAIATYGGDQGAFPANFLDVGGGATAEQVTKAFKIILQDDNVEAILVNIFGGIMKCDIIAEGVLTAVKEVGLDRPLIVRLEGTNVEQGKALIAGSDLEVIAADDLKDGCIKAATAAVEYRKAKGG